MSEHTYAAISLFIGYVGGRGLVDDPAGDVFLWLIFALSVAFLVSDFRIGRRRDCE